MRLNLPFYRQETPFSCVPACLRMVLAGFGVDLDEAALRELCDCTALGTEAFRAVEAVRRLGFPNSMKCNVSVEGLDVELAQGRYPIVYVNLLPIDGVRTSHAVVVVDADAENVTVYDPLVGKRVLPRSAFEQAWRLSNCLMILILGDSEF
ncbi:cysteine peptidase family C39 domain-containing protein [Alkalinema pantanalense CENA528]|uniref:cysteine peptidase family C39 domain-containing protein n=1 Tax=Alkalinema pantanalense TaxID=1620705 RepID=UPI003D6FD683